MVPQINDKSVDFPDPLSPSNNTVSPRPKAKSGTSKENDARPGQRKWTSFSSSIGVVSGN